jgi:Hydrolethalus syndrome protein 1 C-terminus
MLLDLKKLIKYESSPRESTEINIQAGPSTINIQRLFEAHTITSKTKQKEKAGESSKTHQQQQPPPSVQRQIHIQHRLRPATIKEVQELKERNDDKVETEQRPARVKSAGTTRKDPIPTEKPKQKTAVFVLDKKKPQRNPEKADKENIPADNAAAVPPKSKMWIRPKSGSQVNSRKSVKRTDPVSLYQAYQKDWEKFKNNICESSHSDLRWTIREKMMGNH